MGRETDLGSKSDRKAIADAISRYLDANGLSRKELIREHLSKSSIEKLFQGAFTERTLNKVEGILKTSFQRPKAHEAAPKSVGGYLFDAVEHLLGDYLCVRPVFANPTNLSAYLISLSWSDEKSSLVFEEKSRADAKHPQNGTVYIPFGTSFMNLVSEVSGNLRTILLSLPDDDDILRGILSTLSNPKGSTFIPVSAPVFLRKLKQSEKPEFGIISGKHDCYDAYQSLLATVLTEEFGIFAIPQHSAYGRKTIAA
jgi:hypothetical protein